MKVKLYEHGDYICRQYGGHTYCHLYYRPGHNVGGYGFFLDVDSQERRLEAQSNTRLSSPLGATVGESTTVRLTLVNDRDQVMKAFQNWDLIIETLRPGRPGISYLTYTEDSVPGDNECTVSGICRDAEALTAEVVALGIINSGEDMIILAKPAPAIVAGYYDRAVLLTLNGIPTQIIFRASAFLYVADRNDGLVYIYKDDGTYDRVDFFDPDNDDARGLTTDNTNLWTVDVDDLQVNRYPNTFN